MLPSLTKVTLFTRLNATLHVCSRVSYVCRHDHASSHRVVADGSDGASIGWGSYSSFSTDSYDYYSCKPGYFDEGHMALREVGGLGVTFKAQCLNPFVSPRYQYAYDLFADSGEQFFGIMRLGAEVRSTYVISDILQ